jgi:hypothetical protein
VLPCNGVAVTPNAGALTAPLHRPSAQALPLVLKAIEALSNRNHR